MYETGYPQSTTTSRKFVAGAPGVFAMNVYPDATCAGTAVAVAMVADGTTCATTSVATRATLRPFASAATKATDLTYGFYSDATCDTGVSTTAGGAYGYLNGASGTCLALPGGATSAKIEYTSAKMDVGIYGSAGCVTAALGGTISGVPGSCKKLEGVGLAAAVGATYCPATGDCYIYVFPAGAVAPAAMSGASSASLAAVTAAGAVAAAVLLA